MNQKSLGVRIAPFAIGIICFVLPFLQISCDGKRVMQFTGVQLVTGSELKQPMTEETQKIPAEPLAVAALVALLVGVCFCISPVRAASIAAAIAGTAATISMFVLKTRMDAEITKEASGMPITADYLVGFWVVCLAAIAGLILSVVRAKEEENGCGYTTTQQTSDRVQIPGETPTSSSDNVSRNRFKEMDEEEARQLEHARRSGKTRGPYG